MAFTRLFTYIVLFMVGGLLSCSDHPFEPLVTPGSTANRLRVKTLTLDLPNNQAKVSSFRYNAQGRLSQIITYQNPDSSVSDIQYHNYTYDEQNRLTRLQSEVVRYPRGFGTISGFPYNYFYNAAGQVSGISIPNFFSLTFNYNGANQLVSSSRINPISGAVVRGSNSFTFTGSNLTMFSDTRNIPTRSGFADPIITTVNTYTHDDKINPFYGVYLIPAPSGSTGFSSSTSFTGIVGTYFGGIDNVLNLSRNNVLTQIGTSTSTGIGTPGNPFPTTPIQIPTESTVFQYQYNAANLPTVRIKTTTTPRGQDFPPDITVETLRFEYETY